MRKLSIYYVIDNTSVLPGSMLGAINTSLDEFLSDIPDMCLSAEHFPLPYSDKASWTAKNTGIQRWNYLKAGEGEDIAAVLERLKKLLEAGQNDGTRPLVFFFAYGLLPENKSYRDARESLVRCEAFSRAGRHAFILNPEKVGRLKTQLSELNVSLFTVTAQIGLKDLNGLIRSMQACPATPAEQYELFKKAFLGDRQARLELADAYEWGQGARRDAFFAKYWRQKALAARPREPIYLQQPDVLPEPPAGDPKIRPEAKEQEQNGRNRLQSIADTVTNDFKRLADSIRQRLMRHFS